MVARNTFHWPHATADPNPDDGQPGIALDDVQIGSVVAQFEYDRLHRRIVREIKNSADLDCTCHDYYDGQSIIETRNGSDLVLKQQVWGVTYIDELVQIGVNDDPTDGTEDDVESFYYTIHNANYNVQLVVDASGVVVERYEYDPYGQRHVFFSPGTNDPQAYAPTYISRRVTLGGITQPYGLCEFGHQGLFHDEELGLIYNRARELHPKLGRFMQRDPLGYFQGMNLLEYLSSRVTARRDPIGLAALPNPELPIRPAGSSESLESQLIDEYMARLLAGALTYLTPDIVNFDDDGTIRRDTQDSRKDFLIEYATRVAHVPENEPDKWHAVTIPPWYNIYTLVPRKPVSIGVIGTPHTLDVWGSYYIKLHCTSTRDRLVNPHRHQHIRVFNDVEVYAISLTWRMTDEIDANSWPESIRNGNLRRNFWRYAGEGLVDLLGDKVLDGNYIAHIYFETKYPKRFKRSSYTVIENIDLP